MGVKVENWRRPYTKGSEETVKSILYIIESKVMDDTDERDEDNGSISSCLRLFYNMTEEGLNRVWGFKWSHWFPREVSPYWKR